MADGGYASSAPVKIIIRLLLTIALIWALSTFLERIFYVEGGLPAFIIIGSLITLMNLIVRPILKLIMLPFKLFATIIALMVVNGGFLWLTERIAAEMDPAVVVLHIDQGIWGWILVAIILGLANLVMKEILK